jgi:hypothetical protein
MNSIVACHETEHTKRKRRKDEMVELALCEAKKAKMHTMQVDTGYFDCQICAEYLRNPVQCRNGHVVCGNCAKKMLEVKKSTCATCSVKMENPPIRCLHAEIRDDVVLPCKNAGCDFKGPWSEHEKHAQNCENLEVRCPMINKGSVCKFVGTSHEVMMHIYNHHVSFTKKEAEIEIQKRDSQFLSKSCRFKVRNYFKNADDTITPVQSACVIYKDGGIFILKYGLDFGTSYDSHHCTAKLSFEPRLFHPIKEKCGDRYKVVLFLIKDGVATEVFSHIGKITKVLNRATLKLEKDVVLTCDKDMIENEMLIKFIVF